MIYYKKIVRSLLYNFENLNDDYFKTNFNFFKRAKSHLWTHIVMYIGWLILLQFLFWYNNPILIITGMFTIAAYIPVIIIFMIETTFYPKSKLKKRFIYENRIFDFVWIIGQVIFITTTLIILYCFLI